MPNDVNIFSLLGDASPEQIKKVEAFMAAGYPDDTSEHVILMDSDEEVTLGIDILNEFVNGDDELLPIEIVRKIKSDAAAFQAVQDVVVRNVAPTSPATSQAATQQQDPVSTPPTRRKETRPRRQRRTVKQHVVNGLERMSTPPR